MLLNWTAHLVGYLSNSEFATKLACLASKPNTRYYRHTFSNYCQTINQAYNSGHHLLSVLKTSSHFIFCTKRLFYSCSLDVEFSWTWPLVCSVTCLLEILLKDCTVLCHLWYIPLFTSKQHLRFTSDVGCYINLYCIVNYTATERYCADMLSFPSTT